MTIPSPAPEFVAIALIFVSDGERIDKQVQGVP